MMMMTSCLSSCCIYSVVVVGVHGDSKVYGRTRSRDWEPTVDEGDKRMTIGNKRG